MFLDPITIAKFVANPENRAKLAQTWPAKAGKAIWDGITLPGDVWHGNVDPMSDEAIKRATDLAGINMLGTNFSAPVGALGAGPTRLANPIRAYHGSPHDFDKFDMTKIGTGEGAQVYGHGLYFAENPQVAQGYRDRLTQSADVTPEKLARNVLNLYGGDVEKAGAHFERAMNQAYESKNLKAAERSMAARSLLFNKELPANGRIYDVNLHVKPEQLLDWDLPIGNQTNILNNVNKLPEFARPLDMNEAMNVSGQRLYQRLNNKYAQEPEVFSFGIPVQRQEYTPKATSILQEAGIPGIQYLDQFSRNQKTDPTRNFVMFDPDLIEIVGKRATGGAVTEDDSIQTAAHIANKLATGGKVTGYLHTDGNGRTDNLPMKVPNGAYVIPADIVSGLGQGNSLAGRKTLEEIFQRPQFATGGAVSDNDEGIDIIAAGGEYVIDPETVAAIADGDLDLGHEILDRFVVDTRKRIIKEMKSLPGPAQD